MLAVWGGRDSPGIWSSQEDSGIPFVLCLVPLCAQEIGASMTLLSPEHFIVNIGQDLCQVKAEKS